jgi:hypothetical protein
MIAIEQKRSNANKIDSIVLITAIHKVEVNVSLFMMPFSKLILTCSRGKSSSLSAQATPT